MWKEDLQFDRETQNEKFWNKVYNKMFPDLLSVTTVTDLEIDATGIDVILERASGQIINVQKKTVRSSYTDQIVLEYKHEFLNQNSSGDPKGWIEKDLKCDILLYGHPHLNLTWCLNWKQLKKYWDLNKKIILEAVKLSEEWALGKNYGEVVTDKNGKRTRWAKVFNKTYWTHIAVQYYEELSENVNCKLITLH